MGGIRIGPGTPDYNPFQIVMVFAGVFLACMAIYGLWVLGHKPSQYTTLCTWTSSSDNWPVSEIVTTKDAEGHVIKTTVHRKRPLFE